jgi:membrane protein implicated in regulation of membrane protease activity
MFSPTIIAIFITAFGAFGIIYTRIESTRSPYISATLAVVGGTAVAAIVMGLLRQLFARTQSSSESRVGTLLGMNATIITPIPPDGVGEIAYVQAGSRFTAPARSEKGEPISSGRLVRISRIVGTQFYVEVI